ncbi:MAG: iron-sulfur cluster assembly protein, partial [Pseudomonadota bacterium]|nr:iron-sulfur cluster assembly protein [Pseudomonadota bacterium]
MDQPEPAAPAPESPALEARIVTVLESIYDPEIPVSIYALGLIYDIAIDSDAT